MNVRTLISYCNKAIILYKSGGRDELMHKARKRIKSYLFFDVAYMLSLTRNLLSQNQFEKAIKTAKKIVKKAPNLPEAHLILGQCIFSKGLAMPVTSDPNYNSIATEPRYPEADHAMASVNTAIKLSFYYPEAHHLLARIYLLQKKDYAAGIKSAETAIDIAPIYAEAYYTLARCFFARGEVSKALEKIKKAIELAPTYAEAHYSLGNIYYELKELEFAVTCYRAALSIFPFYIEAMLNLALTYDDMENYQEAEKFYRNTIALQPNYFEAHNNLGFLLRKTGRKEEAAITFKIAHDLLNPHLVYNFPTSSFKRNLFLAKKYFFAAADLVTWGIGAKVRAAAWSDFEVLTQGTDGVNYDIFSNILSKISKPKKIKWRDSYIIPWVKPENLHDIQNELEQDGIYVFDQLVENEYLEQFLNYAKTHEATLRPPYANGVNSSTRLIFDPDNPRASHYRFDESKMLEHSIFQQYLGDPVLSAVAQNYFKTCPQVASLNLWWNPVFLTKPSYMAAQIFHNDFSYLKWLKFFVYITDVDKDSGPHVFVRGSHKPHPQSKALRNRGMVQYSDEDIYNHYPADRIFELIGKKGTLFVADTRGFHKGKTPIKNHRLILEMTFANSFFPYFPQKNWAIKMKHPVLKESFALQPKVYDAFHFQ